MLFYVECNDGWEGDAQLDWRMIRTMSNATWKKPVQRQSSERRLEKIERGGASVQVSASKIIQANSLPIPKVLEYSPLSSILSRVSLACKGIITSYLKHFCAALRYEQFILLCNTLKFKISHLAYGSKENTNLLNV